MPIAGGKLRSYEANGGNDGAKESTTIGIAPRFIGVISPEPVGFSVGTTKLAMTAGTNQLITRWMNSAKKVRKSLGHWPH